MLESNIELWQQDEDFSVSAFSDTNKLCYTGGRNGVMTLKDCDGIGRYLIIRSASTNDGLLFYEIFAWEFKHLEADLGTLTFTGMTPDHSGGATLFGVTNPRTTKTNMALSGSEHKLSFDLLTEGVVKYVFFSARDHSGGLMEGCTAISVTATDSGGTTLPCVDIDWAT